MSARPLVLALLALAACGPDAPPEAGPPAAPASGALPDTAMVRDVTPASTAALLAGDLLAVSPSVAIQTVDLWITRIDATQVEGGEEADALAALSDDLTRLRNLLQSSPLDGPAIGRTLRALADSTAGLAAPGTPLAALADALAAQGRRLAPDPPPADSTAGAPAPPPAR